MAPHAAPSRAAPMQSTDLEAGAELRLGEYTNEITLNTSEARVVLQRTLGTRMGRGKYDDTETLAKMRDYLEIFAVFKELAEAQQAETIVKGYGKSLTLFEQSQLGTLVPTCADEAKALIPSLERKVEQNLITDDDLESLCKELQRLKRQAQL